jgi:hypothetical protein
MDIQDRLLALLAPVRTGDELVPGVRLVDASVEAGLRLLFDANGRRLHVEVHPAFGAPAGARWVARSARLLFRYRSGHGDREVDPGTGLAVCQAVARAVAANEDEVLAAVSADAAHARGNVHGGDLVREVRVDRLLMAAETRGPLHYTLSPYVGCLIGCRFCYAQSTIAVVRRLEGRSEAAWGSFVDVRVNAADVLARELGELAPAPINFCPIVSDPYQAVEKRYRLTRSCLEAIAAAGRRWPAMVLTRSTLVLRDLDLLSAMPDVRVGFSIPTIDDGVRAHFEPRGARIADRVSALARLREAGLRTSTSSRKRSRASWSPSPSMCWGRWAARPTTSPAPGLLPETLPGRRMPPRRSPVSWPSEGCPSGRESCRRDVQSARLRIIHRGSFPCTRG